MKKKMMNRKKYLMLLLCLGTACGITGGYSYFSGMTDWTANEIGLIGGRQEEDGAVAVIEPEWDARRKEDENYAYGLEPGDCVEKDPRVESHIEYDCWVFAEVMIPTMEGTLAEEDSPYPYVVFQGEEEVYTYPFEVVCPEINDGEWELYSRQEGKHMISYIYGCKTPLEPYSVTAPLFETMSVPAFLEVEGGDSFLMVRAQAVQTGGCAALDDAAEKLGIERNITVTNVGERPGKERTE